MIRHSGHYLAPRRSAAAALELAILLPFLCLILMLTMDFGRVFYDAVIIAGCARNGALYGSLDAVHSANSTGISTQAKADAGNLTLANVTVTSAAVTDSGGGNSIDVTVTYPFQMATQYLTPHSMTVGWKVRMRVLPTIPNFN